MKATRKANREVTQLFRLCLVNGKLNEDRARHTVGQIIATKPRGYLGALSYFRRLMMLDRAKHTAKIESAKPLDADLQASLQDALARLYGTGLIVSFGENPALLGGTRIQVGSDVYDGSVQSRLAALEQCF
jgi:F-type H+-transporting ATPase subunit delta